MVRTPSAMASSTAKAAAMKVVPSISPKMMSAVRSLRRGTLRMAMRARCALRAPSSSRATSAASVSRSSGWVQAVGEVSKMVVTATSSPVC